MTLRNLLYLACPVLLSPRPVPGKQGPKEWPGLKAHSAVSGRDGVPYVRGWTSNACLSRSPPAFSGQWKPTLQEAETHLPCKGSPWAMSMCGWLEDNHGLTIITHMCAYLSSLSSIFPRVFSFNQPHNKPVKKELAPCEAVVQIQALTPWLCSLGTIISPLNFAVRLK